MWSIVNKSKLYSEFKEKFRAEILKEIDDRKPLSIKDLDFAFIGIDGKKYYHFNNHDLLPLERFAVRKTLMAWMALCLDIKEYDKLVKVGKSALFDLKNQAAKIGFVFEQLEQRREVVSNHTDLLYQFIAVHYVREDEKAESYSDLIQMEKVEQFKKEVEVKGSGFFLDKKELSVLYEMNKWSDQEWTVYWHELHIKETALMTQLDRMLKELNGV